MTAVYVICAATALAALVMSLKRDMMMLQQNSNRNDRYRRWMREAGESTAITRLLALVAVFIFLIGRVPASAAALPCGIVSLGTAVYLATRHYKKPLVFTHRARRIYSVAIFLALVLGSVAFFVGDGRMGMPVRPVIAWLACTFTLAWGCSYLFILASNWLLRPVEARINRRYYNEAASILRSIPGLRVVGITGSYGKTSTKHYLHRILSEKYEVLMTPGNFNTTLGVIRTVREQMQPYTQVFIAEMGAKQKGDIAEICELVHPEVGIITSVGPQHLESFGTIQNVRDTKFELADSLPASGLAVLNNDFEQIALRQVGNCKVVRYSAEANRPADYHATDIEYGADGTRFTISDADGGVISLHTRLVGRCNVQNLMAAVITALHLGVEEDKIRRAVERIEQVEHRLNIKRTASGITIIDDAYNSNPVGSEMALEVLSGMKGGKRIVITPGMIELGDEQYELNRRFGEFIAGSADLAIIVGEYNRDAILEGIESVEGVSCRVIKASTFAEAQKLMLTLAKAGDTVLYENDLPDTFK